MIPNTRPKLFRFFCTRLVIPKSLSFLIKFSMKLPFDFWETYCFTYLNLSFLPRYLLTYCNSSRPLLQFFKNNFVLISYFLYNLPYCLVFLISLLLNASNSNPNSLSSLIFFSNLLLHIGSLLPVSFFSLLFLFSFFLLF